LTIPLTNKEILEKAIQKAIDGGYDHIPYSVTEHADFLIESKALPLIIYRHDFAKALWGEGQATTRYDVFPNKDGKFGNNGNVGWKSHLMFMVISPDPIQYLKDNLRD